MRGTVSLEDIGSVAAIRRHLRAHQLQRTDSTTDGCTDGCKECGLPAPRLGSVIRVTESIQTCHPTSGKGLDTADGNSLPPGEYKVDKAQQHEGVGHSHWLILKRLSDDAEVELCYGYTGKRCMDWRGVAPLVSS